MGHLLTSAGTCTIYKMINIAIILIPNKSREVESNPGLQNVKNRVGKASALAATLHTLILYQLFFLAHIYLMYCHLLFILTSQWVLRSAFAG